MNLFELFVKIGVDDQASGNLSKISSSLGKGLSTAAKIGTAAVGAAAAGITALTTTAVNNYAEYEQLVGGVETLFKTSSDKVMGYAENAYKTAGLSANEYMETVTSFSASLLQSLDGDTAAAAEKANLAITDMADNANKMGTSMESIQNAYQGFAKQNYTMLDNLKLGYGGTKEEMERLIADAAKLSDTVDAQSMSFDNIAEAIHVVQTEMGITGTTAKEAGTTIQGAVSSMKSAWTNLLTGLSDGNANIEQLVDNLVTTIVGDGTETNLGVLGNILPAVQTALNGASTLISAALPKIMEIIPAIINDNLPVLAEAAVSIIQSLIDGISQNQEMLFETIFGVVIYLSESFVTMLPQIVELGLNLIVSLANGIAESLPELIPTIVDVVLKIVQTLIDNIPLLIDAALQLITGLAQGIINAIPVIVAALPQAITSLIDGLLSATPQIIQAGIDLLTALVAALPEIIAAIVEAIPQIIDGIITALTENIPLIIQAGIDLLVALIQALPEIIVTIVQAIPQIISSIVNALIGNIDQIIMAGVQLFVALIENLPTIIVEIVKAVPQIIEGIVEAFASLGGELVDAGADLLHGLWEGISGAASWLWEKVSGWASSLVSDIKDFFGIHSPSTVFAEIGGYMAEGLGEGWENEYGNIKKQIEGDMNFGTATVDFASSGVGQYTGAMQSAFGDIAASINQNATIVVQSVLDGKVIGETAYKYARGQHRALGVV